MAETYKDAGVDIEAGEALVDKIKQRVSQTYGSRVLSGVGGFASLYDLGHGKLLASSTDGVGTKLMVAQRLGVHNTVGIDLVAMCINDMLCTGARGLFFMDYLATGKLNLSVCDQILSGIVEGCSQAGVALIGGETAEMPGMYADGTYDLAGFVVGEVSLAGLIDGSRMQQGDAIVGIASSGIHANGLSLARRLGTDNDEDYWKALLTPTKIYTREVEALLASNSPIHGLAHITGGGLRNLGRLNQKFDCTLDAVPSLDDVPNIFLELKKRSALSDVELYKTFNMGVGLCVVTPDPVGVMTTLETLGTRSWKVGQVVHGTGRVLLGRTVL